MYSQIFESSVILSNIALSLASNIDENLIYLISHSDLWDDIEDYIDYEDDL